MVVAPAHWLKKLMELTQMSWGFKMYIIALGIAYMLAGWVFERYLSGRLVRMIGDIKHKMSGTGKKRKAYKVILESMRT